MKSILQTEKVCYLCGSHNMLESHHVYNGNPNRKLSEQYGLKVYLCHYCHNEPPNGVHFNLMINLCLKANTQKKAMQHYGWDVDTFRSIFGKSYL